MYGDLKDDIRRAIEFRYQLSPYLYSLMERAHRTGLPIMEPMCSAFQNDVKCYEEGVDFMFGDSLLVANVVEKGAATRKVYLPEGGTFYDFYTREAYEGGQTIEIPVTISSIPLFVTGGAIIPMASNAIDNLATQKATGLPSSVRLTGTPSLISTRMTVFPWTTRMENTCGRRFP